MKYNAILTILTSNYSIDSNRLFCYCSSI